MVNPIEIPSKSEDKPTITMATLNDLDGILNLQKENLHTNLTDKERQIGGYVTVETPIEFLQEVVKNEGIIISKFNDELAGYLIPLTIESCKKDSLLKELVENFKNIKYSGRFLTEYNCCFIGQVCVAKKFRGVGIFEELYKSFKERMSRQGFELGVTAVSPHNPRSVNAHINKAGFKIAKKESGHGKEWYMIVLDLRIE